MKNLNIFKGCAGLTLLWAIFVISSCKKEVVAKALTTTTIATDSANYFKGYLGDEPVKFEGNASFYNVYADPDSAENRGPGHHDNDAAYISGSKWAMLSATGLQSTNAVIELRSLAVRVYVSPIVSASTTFYNLLGPSTYAYGDVSTGKSVYVAMHDKTGQLWTTDGDQDGSTITILSRGENMTTYTVVSGTVTCNMYDGRGNMKKLTTATFTAALGI